MTIIYQPLGLMPLNSPIQQFDSPDAESYHRGYRPTTTSHPADGMLQVAKLSIRMTPSKKWYTNFTTRAKH